MKILKALFLIFGLTIFANAQKATLSGTIYYAEKFKVENAKVQAENTKGQIFETKTDANGIYKMKLPSGSYKVIFQHCSIETESHNLYVTKGQKLKLDIKQPPSIVDGCGMSDEIPIQTLVRKINRKITKRKK